MGDFDFSRTAIYSKEQDDLRSEEEDVGEKNPLQGGTRDKTPIDIISYRPTVVNREWIISELDLEFISCGCYILGTGGGGSPYSHFIRLREMMRKGAVVRVIDPYDLADDAMVACGGKMLSSLLHLRLTDWDHR